MLGYLLDGHNLSPLFDTSVKPISFAEDPDEHVPDNGSIVYSIWDKDDNFIYIGFGGTNQLPEKRDPRKIISSHASGMRMLDVFCMLVFDYFVVPSLVTEGVYEPERFELNRRTKDFIRSNLSYRFLSFKTDDSNEIVVNLVDKIRDGELGITPKLNRRGPWVKDD